MSNMLDFSIHFSCAECGDDVELDNTLLDEGQMSVHECLNCLEIRALNFEQFKNDHGEEWSKDCAREFDALVATLRPQR